MTDPGAMQVFDRNAVRAHRERAATRFEEHRFLADEVASRLVDRLHDMARRFPLALELGARDGDLAARARQAGKIDMAVVADLSPRMARLAAASGHRGLSVCADEEFLPFAPRGFDLVFSNLSLHWVNDLPGALIQAQRCLKPDGLFLAAMLGGSTLSELRQILLETEIGAKGGAAPRLSPFADARDAAGLLQRAGFALPVADSDRITVKYRNLPSLLYDLRFMGETNAVLARPRGFTAATLFAEAADRYADRHADEDGRIPATFEVIYLAGWAPAETQQKPLRPGSAAQRLADALGAVEIASGIKAAPKE
jgi:SAM-dependent methyltransferase